VTAKEILHRLIEGFSPYLSCGVPKVYWDLAITFTGEVYGSKGIDLLESTHAICNDATDARNTKILHFIDLPPTELIESLEALNGG